MKVTILGVQIDRITKAQALERVVAWVNTKSNNKYVIVTPNPEFLIAAQDDSDFKSILNQADLAIPDSSRFGWLEQQLKEPDPLKKLVHWFRFPFSSADSFPVVPGVDLMNDICRVFAERGYTIGLIGGGDGVAERAAECLVSRYKTLKIAFATDGGQVEKNGAWKNPQQLAPCDLVFVAFGQVKQEKWIEKYKSQVKGTVFMGVGGSFDYISGLVTRAPGWMRSLGLEWLFRLVIQPWRIKRQWEIFKFLFKLL